MVILQHITKFLTRHQYMNLKENKMPVKSYSCSYCANKQREKITTTLSSFT